MLVAAILDIIQNDSKFYEIGKQQIAIMVLGLTMTMFAGAIVHHSTLGRAIRSTKLPSFVIFTLSILIFATNLTGFLLPLRNPAVYEGIPFAGKEREVQYSAAEVYAQMDRIEEIDEQYPEYVKRLTQLIYDGTVHYWKYDQNNAFNLRIPIYENYLIYFKQLKQVESANYEFCRAERAIERAVSVCSQASKIMADILLKNRVRTQIVEHDLDEIEANLDIVREAYQKHGYNDQVIENLVDIYGAEDNQIIDKNLKCAQEDYLYLLKWLIPILGLLPFLMFMIMHFTRRKRK